MCSIMSSNSQYYNYYYYCQWYNYYKCQCQQSYTNFGFPNASPQPPSTLPFPPPHIIPQNSSFDCSTENRADLIPTVNSNSLHFKPSTVENFTFSKEPFSNLHKVISTPSNDPNSTHLPKNNFAPTPGDSGMQDTSVPDTGSPVHSTQVYYWGRRMVISQGQKDSSTSDILMSKDTESVTHTLDKTSENPFTLDLDAFRNDISSLKGIYTKPGDQIPWFCLPPPSPPPEEPLAPSTLGGVDLPEQRSPDPLNNDVQAAPAFNELLAVSKPKVLAKSVDPARSSLCQKSVSKKNKKKKKLKMSLKSDSSKLSSFNASSEERVKLEAFEKSISHLPQVLKDKFGPLKCNLCEVDFSSVKTGLAHYEGKLHRKKVNRNLIYDSENNLLSVAIFPIECNICGVVLTSAHHRLDHYSGKLHKKKTWHKKILEIKARKRAPEEWEETELVLKDYKEAIQKYYDLCNNMECDNYCRLCDLFTLSAEALAKHCQEPKHLKRERKKSCLAKGGEEIEVEEEEKEYLHQFKKSTGEFYCCPCDYSADNVSMFESHLESVLHQCMVRK